MYGVEFFFCCLVIMVFAYLCISTSRNFNLMIHDWIPTFVTFVFLHELTMVHYFELWLYFYVFNIVYMFYITLFLLCCFLFPVLQSKFYLVGRCSRNLLSVYLFSLYVFSLLENFLMVGCLAFIFTGLYSNMDFILYFRWLHWLNFFPYFLA